MSRRSHDVAVKIITLILITCSRWWLPTLRASKTLHLVEIPLAVCLNCLISFIRIFTFHRSTHTHTHTCTHGIKEGRPKRNTSPLVSVSWASLKVKWWRILKQEKKSKKIKITRAAAKLRAQSPDVFPPFSLSLFPSHLTPHEAWRR